MRYDDPELLKRLASEYVLGTMRGPARRRFEALLATSAEARFQRDFWEQRLGEFARALAPVAPPFSVRAELMRRAQPVAAPARRRWRHAALFAAAASLVLAFLIGQRFPAGTPSPAGHPRATAAAPVQERDDPLAIYAAQVRMPASSVGWLISLTPDHRQLMVVASEDFLQAGRGSPQLWCMGPDGTPILVGSLPSERDRVATFDIPQAVRGQGLVRFAISLEPDAATQRPTRPVLNEANSLAEI